MKASMAYIVKSVSKKQCNGRTRNILLKINKILKSTQLQLMHSGLNMIFENGKKIKFSLKREHDAQIGPVLSKVRTALC